MGHPPGSTVALRSIFGIKKGAGAPFVSLALAVQGGVLDLLECAHFDAYGGRLGFKPLLLAGEGILAEAALGSGDFYRHHFEQAGQREFASALFVQAADDGVLQMEQYSLHCLGVNLSLFGQMAHETGLGECVLQRFDSCCSGRLLCRHGLFRYRLLCCGVCFGRHRKLVLGQWVIRLQHAVCCVSEHSKSGINPKCLSCGGWFQC